MKRSVLKLVQLSFSQLLLTDRAVLISHHQHHIKIYKIIIPWSWI